MREAQNREMVVGMEMNYDDSAYSADDSRPLEELLFGNPMDPIDVAVVQLGHGSLLLSAGAGLALIWRTAEPGIQPVGHMAPNLLARGPRRRVGRRRCR